MYDTKSYFQNQGGIDDLFLNAFFFFSVDPNFYSMNLAMLGKTYVRMGKNDDARNFLSKVSDNSVRTVDDKKVRIYGKHFQILIIHHQNP